MSDSKGRAPLHARVFHYKLTCSEFCLVQAMIQHNSGGDCVYASIARLAAYSGLHERTIQKLIHGQKRRGRYVPGLLDRGILTELAPGNSGKRKSATYRVNEAALELKPEMTLYRNLQQGLPGIGAPVGEPVIEGAVAGGPGASTDGPGAPGLVAQGQESGGPGAPNLKAFDSDSLLIQKQGKERERNQNLVVTGGPGAPVPVEPTAEQMHFRAWMQIRDESRATGEHTPYEACVKARGGWKGCHIWHDELQHIYATMPSLGRLTGSRETRSLQQTLAQVAGVKGMD